MKIAPIGFLAVCLLFLLPVLAAQEAVTPEELTISNLPPHSSLFYLYTSKDNRVYLLKHKNQLKLPVFISTESAQSFASILSSVEGHPVVSRPVTTDQLKDLLSKPENKGVKIKLLEHGAQPKYKPLRPMTWGVISSYLTGTILVLLICWAITKYPHRHPH